MKINKHIISFVICIFCLANIVSAQKLWEKPMSKWNKGDALKIVSDSPWAKTYQSIAAAAAASQRQIGREQADSVNRGGGGSGSGSFSRSGGNPPVVIRLHSALPIRQAIIRGTQIASNYDKMSDKEKTEFDQSSSGFLTCAICENYYVISLTQLPDTTGQTIQEAIFQTLTNEDLKGNVWLENDKGEKRELAQFTAPKHQGESAYFFFARKDDKGNVLLTPDNKDFEFKFDNKFLNSANPYAGLVPISFEFKVSKILLANKVEF